MRRGLCVVAALVALLFIASSASAMAARDEEHTKASTDVVELVYVKGCAGDSTPLRQTSGCFAEGRSEERVSLRGLHFPVHEDGTAPDLHVVFQESRLPSIFEDEPGYAGSVSTTDGDDAPVQLQCAGVTPSSLFPSQLLTCTLPRPSTESLEAHGDTARANFLARARQYPVWLDAKLVWKGRVVSVLRRAVEVDLRAAPKRAAAAARYDSDAAPSGGNHGTGLDSLERLYVPSSNGATDDPDDVWRTELGVGGLKEELQLLYRRVFLSRLPTLAPITTALGLQHVRGAILYGPPGNGKTLIARGLVRLLGPNTRLTIVNAGDVLSKYVGESEKNLRDLFEGRELGSTARQEDEDTEQNHDTRRPSNPDSETPTDASAAPLHVLVIDEFDALFRRRGHSDDESSAKAVFDGVTNALLSLMDGVKSRNDILVIGLTNRLDAVDEALIRPGRFEVLVEVPAPGQNAREEIFFIHTEKLRQQGFLEADIHVEQLAAQTTGFSGSDIAGVVRAATSRALLRYRQEAAHAAPDGECTDVSSSTEHQTACAQKPSFRVTAAEFAAAVKEVRDAKRDHGAESSSAWADERVELVDHDGTLLRSVGTVVNLTSRLRRASSASSAVFAAAVAISGPAGSGKSVLARHIAQQIPDVGGVQFLSGQRLAELADVEETLSAIQRAFTSASKARGLNIVVIDDVDVLIAGLRGNARAQSRFASMTRSFMQSRTLPAAPSSRSQRSQRYTDLHVHPDNHHTGADTQTPNTRLLIVTATKRSVLRDLGAVDCQFQTHPITRSGVRRALAFLHVVEDAQSPYAAALSEAYPVSLNYGEFLRVTQMALQSSEWRPAAPETEEQEAPTSGSAESAPAEKAFVRDDGTTQQFMSAVRQVVSSMGLYDPFQAWYTVAGQQKLLTPEEILEKAKNHELDDADTDGSELLW